MGKSPGRWIKKVLLGKKSSKTQLAKGREKTATEDDGFSAPCVISNPIPITSSLSERNSEIENQDGVDSQNNRGMSLKETQDANSEVSTPQLASSYEEKILQEEPATSAQDYQKTANQKEIVVTSRATGGDLSPLSPVISNPIPSERHLELQNQDSLDLQNNGGMSLQSYQDENSEVLMPQLALSNEEKIRQEEAATFAQAAFRGYRARRAFRALKGLIRLQALIRGHLVRRQAVATLCCMQGIVKLQALYRGTKVRNSDLGREISEKCSMVKAPDGKLGDTRGANISIHKAKLSANVFVFKLVASAPKGLPLGLCYDSVEPNSVQNWLERWTMSNFWKPIPQPKRNPDLKSQRRYSNGQMLEAETGRPKCSLRRVPASNVDYSFVKTASDQDKPKHNFRKIPSHVAETVQDNPQNEIEKVKQNLRKVRKDVTENAARPEFEVEKSKDGLENMSGTAINNLLVKKTGNSWEKMKKETSPTQKQPDLLVKNKPILETTENPDTETTIDQLIVTGVQEIHGNQAIVISEPQLENCQRDENIPPTNKELNRKDNPMEDDNHKRSKKASYLRKQESTENGLQSSASVPSYMAVTESAKAKLRAQGSPRLSQDGAERSNSARRHSLPSGNGKISSHSPRTRAVHSGGKSKSDRSASREGNAKVTQTEWRR